MSMPPAPPLIETDPPSTRSSWRNVIWPVAIVGALVVIVAGYEIGKNQGWFATGSMDSNQVAAQISERYTKISGQQIDVTCPSIPQQKGKISDCTATVAGTGQTTTVFVTQIDTGGHFSYQPEDSSILVAATPPDASPVEAPAAPELSAEDAAKENDKGWVLESTSYKTDLGDTLGVVMRVKNANADTATGVFTMTILDGGSVLATYQGSAQAVPAGQTVTVDTFSTNSLSISRARTLLRSKGAEFQFQTDASY